MWTARQRGMLIVLVAGLALLMAVRYALNPVRVDEPPPLGGARAAELLDRLDPNTADAESLAALPVLGLAIAQRIVEYREAFHAQHPNQRAFARPQDLTKVKGIGPATAAQIERHLWFPGNDSSDQETR